MAAIVDCIVHAWTVEACGEAFALQTCCLSAAANFCCQASTAAANSSSAQHKLGSKVR